MVGHAAAAEWLRTLPWWDWRGWSDWFFGGQAIGVNYPPLAHAWLRFTHPVHGQMAAVAVGLLVLLPWGALRLARAVGLAPRAQRAAVGAVLVLTAASGGMHWVLSGFQLANTFFGSWPAMLATVLGLFCAAWAARCHKPVVCGLVAGLAILFNATVVPGVAVVCAALLVTSGVSLRQGIRWSATAMTAALAVCAWWLVPFLAGWGRLVRWEVSLAEAWAMGSVWQAAVLAVLGVATAWALRSGNRVSRRLATAAVWGVLATLLAELFGYLRPERWLGASLLVAAVAAAGVRSANSRPRDVGPVRPAWALTCSALLIVFVTITLRFEVIPLAVWLLLWPRRSWAWGGGLAWACILLWVPLATIITNPGAVGAEAPETEGNMIAQHNPEETGLLHGAHSYSNAAGDTVFCNWNRSGWGTAKETDGRIRPLAGLYQETSHVAEFLLADVNLRLSTARPLSEPRPHWVNAWSTVGEVSVDTVAAAEALGARWYSTCVSHDEVAVLELSGTMATGTTVKPYIDESSWHRAAVEWWLSIAAGVVPGDAHEVAVPALVRNGEVGSRDDFDVAAQGVTLRAAEDSLVVHADTAGWAWLRVPWDPDWRSLDSTPVLKGGPGHLVVWASEGETRLRWAVPTEVDVAAAATTGAASLTTVGLAVLNRRRGWQIDPHRKRPVANACAVFAGTVDDWAHAAARRVRAIWSVARRRVRL